MKPFFSGQNAIWDYSFPRAVPARRGPPLSAPTRSCLLPLRPYVKKVSRTRHRLWRRTFPRGEKFPLVRSHGTGGLGSRSPAKNVAAAWFVFPMASVSPTPRQWRETPGDMEARPALGQSLLKRISMPVANFVDSKPPGEYPFG